MGGICSGTVQCAYIYILLFRFDIESAALTQNTVYVALYQPQVTSHCLSPSHLRPVYIDRRVRFSYPNEVGMGPSCTRVVLHNSNSPLSASQVDGLIALSVTLSSS